MKIYTKTGDQGETGLFGGPRVSKDHARIEAFGTVDELNSHLGLIRTLPAASDFDGDLRRIQCELFDLGAELATPGSTAERITPAHVTAIERLIDAQETLLEPLACFILPTGTPLAAALHVARTVCRRSERAVIRLQHETEVPPIVVVYLNRLSDLLFVLARVANRRAGAGEVTW